MLPNATILSILATGKRNSQIGQKMEWAYYVHMDVIGPSNYLIK